MDFLEKLAGFFLAIFSWQKYTHLDRDKKDFGNQCHHVRVVWALLERFLSHELLQEGKEVVNQLVQIASFRAFKRQFKCLEDGFERAQGGCLKSLIV